ncbi:hypothetical protein GC170_04305 [bacterium]|nr:hypothetical protein [bacterium]
MRRGGHDGRHLLTLLPALGLILWGTLTPLAVTAQNPAPGGETTVDEAIKDVSTRYRFREVFSIKNVEPIPGEIAQSRSAFRETLAMTVDSPKGAPIKSERSRQLIYSERPAILGQGGRVDAVVRRFETFRFDPAPQGFELEKNKPMEGLMVFAMRAQEGENIISLVPDRQITDLEFNIATSVPSIMNDSELLPTTPLRLGDSWPLSRTAARVLLGRGRVNSTSLMGTLKSVQPSAQDETLMSALVAISGQVVTDKGTCSLNLQYQFEFSTKTSLVESSVGGVNRDGGTILTVQGGLRKLSLAQVEISDLPESQGRLKQVFDRKLVFERQLAGRQEPIELPTAAPTATKENSWLVFVDSSNRIKINHPPILRPFKEEENLIEFESVSGFKEFVRIDLDGGDIKPEGLRKDLEKEWTAEGFEIFAVSENYLKDDWGDRRVYRVEAALQATDTGNNQRSQFDAYVIQFPQNMTIVAESVSFSPQPAAFRDMIEEMLKTIELSVPAAPKAPADVVPADANKPPEQPAAQPEPAPKP